MSYCRDAGMKKYIALGIIIMAGLLPVQYAAALGVSDVELRSSLNQKLDARIYLLSVTEGELGSLKLQIRIQDMAGASRTIALDYAVVEEEQQKYIAISSKDAMREPVLNFQLELNWSQGRLTREYSLIIDPQ
jgi:pilus assembly protein FimV